MLRPGLSLLRDGLRYWCEFGTEAASPTAKRGYPATTAGQPIRSVAGSYRFRAARRRARAAFKSCLNKSISKGLSIRGVFEVASFRPGKAVEVEAEPEPFSPLVFEVSPMFASQSFNLRAVGSQLR
jgi:hypothetical protein